MAVEDSTDQSSSAAADGAVPSLREDLEAAISEVDTTLDSATTETSAGVGTTTPKPPGTGVLPAAAATTPADAPAPAADAPAADAPAADAAAPATYPDDARKYPTLDAAKLASAPASWRPAAREGWAQLSPDVRREIHRRELDVSSGLQDAGGARRSQERLDGFATTYGAAMAAEGVSDPLDAAEGLFRTAAQLRLGTPQEKAERMAQLISHYAVDVNLLDSSLAKHIQNGAAAPGAAAVLDPAVQAQLQPMQDFIAELQGRLADVDRGTNAAAEQSVEAFRENAEFLNELRLPMADLLDTAGSNNLPMTLQEAYDVACQMHPEIRAVLAQRGAATAGQQTAQRLAGKVATAGASVHAPPAGESVPASNGDMRGDILRAMADLEAR